MKENGEKVAWEGEILAVQPRIRMTRCFDQRHHGYSGYVLRVRGRRDGEDGEFVVAIGKAAQAKHAFRVGDVVKGKGHPVVDARLETADLYKVSGLKRLAWGPESFEDAPPFLGVPPILEVYRERGHRRLASRTYQIHCKSCLWGCAMVVEIIVDQRNPSRKEYRRESFCYGPKSCPLYEAGATRHVPGRNGRSWEEEDWVDEDATAHRGPDD